MYTPLVSIVARLHVKRLHLSVHGTRAATASMRVSRGCCATISKAIDSLQFLIDVVRKMLTAHAWNQEDGKAGGAGDAHHTCDHRNNAVLSPCRYPVETASCPEDSQKSRCTGFHAKDLKYNSRCNRTDQGTQEEMAARNIPTQSQRALQMGRCPIGTEQGPEFS